MEDFLRLESIKRAYLLVTYLAWWFPRLLTPAISRFLLQAPEASKQQQQTNIIIEKLQFNLLNKSRNIKTSICNITKHVGNQSIVAYINMKEILQPFILTWQSSSDKTKFPHTSASIPWRPQSTIVLRLFPLGFTPNQNTLLPHTTRWLQLVIACLSNPDFHTIH